MALHLTRDFDPRYGEAVEVAPSVRRITAKNPGAMTFHGTNTYLVGDGGSLVAIDPGPDDADHLAATLRAIGGATVERILITHAHRDHTLGAPALRERTGAHIFGARKQVHASATAAGTAHPLLDGFIQEGTIETGAGPIEAIATPGHASDHLVFVLPDRGILFSGDHVMGWSTTVISLPDGSMSDYFASLDRLLGRGDHLYLPGHGGPIEQPDAHVRALKAHRQGRQRTILRALQNGDRTIDQLVARLYRRIEPARHRAAAASVLAHLQHLVALGLVSADGAVTPDATYRPAAAALAEPPATSG